MLIGFAAGVTATVAVLLLARWGRREWPWYLARKHPHGFRLIPPPKVGRWQVWAVSAYHAIPDRTVGRYRLRWSARIVAWGHMRQTSRTAWRRFEVRRVTLPRDKQTVPVAALDDLTGRIIEDHNATYHPGRQCRENEGGDCIDRFGGQPRHEETS